MTPADLRADVLRAVRDQLDTVEAATIAYLAEDDPVLFGASVLAHVSTGALTLSADQLRLVTADLRQTADPV
jgi:hypothetical protein